MMSVLGSCLGRGDVAVLEGQVGSGRSLRARSAEMAAGMHKVFGGHSRATGASCSREGTGGAGMATDSGQRAALLGLFAMLSLSGCGGNSPTGPASSDDWPVRVSGSCSGI